MEKYNIKTNIPQYEPKDTPHIEEIYDLTKYRELLSNIKASNVSEEEKKFLKIGAFRHIVYNYSKIADYYASASKEMQELMEQSALVIIDFNDAIANGYVRLSKNMNTILSEKVGEVNA